jgi:two-component system, cell cycle response regulator
VIYKRFEELKQSSSLPTPSGVGLVILRRTQDDTCSLEELAQCIQVDPALSGRILNLANTGAWQGLAPVTSVQEAARRLGARAVRSLALSFSLVSSNRSGVCAHFDYERYWSYSLACASAAQILAGEHGVIEPNEAFSCALLSRIGLLALASVHPELFAATLEAHRQKSISELLIAERSVFDIQHWEVASSLLAEWGLPDFFTQAIQSLGSPPRDPLGEDPLMVAMSKILRDSSIVAEGLVRSIEKTEWPLGADWIALLAPVDGTVADSEWLRPVSEQAAALWREWGALFRLPTSSQVAAASLQSTQFIQRQLLSMPVAPALTAVQDRLEGRGVCDAIAPLSPGEIKVLAIDDDPRILRLLRHYLRQSGYEVLTAQNGEEGLQIVLDESPQIVVTDWMMPALSGIELCRALRRIDAGRRTYVVMLTARDDEQQVVDAFDAGADDFVTKPFNARILLARVQAGQRLVELQRQVEADKQQRTHQVAEMGLMTRKLRAAALTDVLTDLPNRRYALSRLAQEWELAAQMNRPLSVVMVDIDHFKQINDRHGHDVGDIVLKETAAILRAKTRRGDVVCRLGGEEFLVINVNSDLYGAQMCAERLRAGVEANHLRCEGFDGYLTVSLGCAERSNAITDVDDLLKAADEAVYAAKSAGRNTVREARRRLPEAG